MTTHTPSLPVPRTPPAAAPAGIAGLAAGPLAKLVVIGALLGAGAGAIAWLRPAPPVQAQLVAAPTPSAVAPPPPQPSAAPSAPPEPTPPATVASSASPARGPARSPAVRPPRSPPSRIRSTARGHRTSRSTRPRCTWPRTPGS